MMEQLRNTQESVVNHCPIDQSQVSRYLKNKIQTMKDTADNYWKKLLRDQSAKNTGMFIQHYDRSLKKQELEAIM